MPYLIFLLIIASTNFAAERVIESFISDNNHITYALVLSVASLDLSIIWSKGKIKLVLNSLNIELIIVCSVVAVLHQEFNNGKLIVLNAGSFLKPFPLDIVLKQTLSSLSFFPHNLKTFQRSFSFCPFETGGDSLLFQDNPHLQFGCLVLNNDPRTKELLKRMTFGQRCFLRLLIKSVSRQRFNRKPFPFKLKAHFVLLKVCLLSK